MRMPEDPSGYISNWKYFEVAKYVSKLNKVIRLKSNDLPLMLTDDSLIGFVNENNNTGIYTSVWRYNSDDLEKATRLASLYFDIDNKDQKQSLSDCVKLYNYLLKFIPEESIIVYFTGKKGFHIECEAIALGINPSNNLPNIFRFIAQSLKDKLGIDSLDFSVYDARRMWRLAGSRHQDTGLYKNIISRQMLSQGMPAIIDHCRSESDNAVPQQLFNAKANEWYREFTYELEVSKERSKDFIGYFNKHGSTGFKSFQESEKEFTVKNLIENCSAVRRLWQQAIDQKFLEHEARLFLCSILTYNEESIKFLHGILSNCDDYNVEKTNSHINDWIKRRQLGIGGRPYTCERANSVGVGCGDCSLERKNKWIKIGDKYVETSDQSSPSPVRFAYKTLRKEVPNNE